MTIVVVEIVEVGLLFILRFVITSLDAPDVRPVRRRGMIGAEQVIRTRNPLVEIFLHEPLRDDSGFDHAAQTVVAGAHVEGFFAQHVRGRAAERCEGGKLQHLELEFTVAVDEVGVGKEVEPVVDVDVECAQQAFIFKSTALQHFLRFDFAGGPEEVDEQGAHLPAVTHLFDHHAGQGATVPVGGRNFEQVALLLNRGKFGVALVDDHVHERVAHLLSGYLPQVLPLTASFEGSELNVVGFDRAVEGVEVKRRDVILIDADLLAPVVEQTDPVAEASDFRYFTWHSKPLFRRVKDAELHSADGSETRPHTYYFAVKVAGRFST